MRAIISVPNGYNGGTVEVYADPVGVESVWRVNRDGTRDRIPYYVALQCVAHPVTRSLTFEEHRAACEAAGVPVPTFDMGV